MIKAIFYDFDGVIKESTDIKSKAFYDLYLPFGENIAKEVQNYHIQHGGVSRYEKIKYWHKEYLNKDITEEELHEWAQKFSDLVMKKVVESPYVNGAKNTIEKLSHVYDQYIITGTPQNEIEKICDQLYISSLFKKICGSPKNKIKWCNQLIRQTGYTNTEIVFIGDATTDYEAAIHHKLHFVLRSHEENESLFSGKNVIKIKDLLSLESIIKNID